MAPVKKSQLKGLRKLLKTDYPVFMYRDDEIVLPVLNKFIENNRLLRYAISVNEFEMAGLDVAKNIAFYLLDESTQVIGRNYLLDTH